MASDFCPKNINTIVHLESQYSLPSYSHFAHFQEDLGLQEATYELHYNAACALIGQGRVKEAMESLQKAEGKDWQAELGLSLQADIIWRKGR